MAFMSKLNVLIPGENGAPDVTEQYDIAALQLVQATNREPYSVGDSTTPVYFQDGIPYECEISGGGGAGGSTVSITPNYTGGNLVAKYKIDGKAGALYSPKVGTAYKRTKLWEMGDLASGLSNVGDNNDSKPLSSSISNYSFLLIHYAPSNNINEARTMMLDAKLLANAVGSQTAFFSCHYLSDVFIKCKFKTQTTIEVVESSSLPLPNDQSLKCVVKQIDGLIFGVSGEDLTQGLNVIETLWGPGSADVIDQIYNFKKDAIIDDYNFIYIHYCETASPYDEKILILDETTIKKGLKPEGAGGPQSYFTCYITDNLYIKGLFINEKQFKIVEFVDDGLRHCVIKQIDGVSLGASNVPSGGGGDTSDCMKKGIDYVTAGKADGSEIGDNATAEGFNNIADGDYSHAEGTTTYAHGGSSHAEGSSTYAEGSDAHAEGEGTYAGGIASHSEGIETSAYKMGAHAEGAFTSVNSAHSHSEGSHTSVMEILAFNPYTQKEEWSVGGHSEGYYTYASGWGAHSEGYFTTASGSESHTEGHNTYSFSGHSEGSSTSSLTRAHAEGMNTCAIGTASHAEGGGTTVNQTVAVGNQSHAEGRMTTACGEGSHAEGFKSYAIGKYAHAEGGYTSTAPNVNWSGTYANGESSHAEGFRTYANGNNAHAEGQYSTADGRNAHAEGYKTSACGESSHAEGGWNNLPFESAKGGTFARGDNSHAEGYMTYAEGYITHAEGYKTTAYSYNSTSTILQQANHAEGVYTSASGRGCHSEGYGASSNSVVAFGDGSHAEGCYTTAYGAINTSQYTLPSGTHAEGTKTYAYSGQHVEGRWNEPNSNLAHIMGGGTSAQTKNVFTIDWQGNVVCKSLSQTSSRKVKNNIKNMSEQEAKKILQLRPVSFDYIEGEGDKNCYGLIAEEVQEIGINYPIFNGYMSSKNEECLQLDYSKFVPYLIKMIQIQEERINTLEQKLREKE